MLYPTGLYLDCLKDIWEVLINAQSTCSFNTKEPHISTVLYRNESVELLCDECRAHNYSLNRGHATTVKIDLRAIVLIQPWQQDTFTPHNGFAESEAKVTELWLLWAEGCMWEWAHSMCHMCCVISGANPQPMASMDMLERSQSKKVTHASVVAGISGKETMWLVSVCSLRAYV